MGLFNFFDQCKQATIRSVFNNGSTNHLLLENPDDSDDYTGYNELNDKLAILETSLNAFKDNNDKHKKALKEHAQTLANNARKYINETRTQMDKTIATQELSDALNVATALLNNLNKQPEDYNLPIINNNIEDCRKASNTLDKDIHKYNFKATLLMLAALAVSILAITLLTTLTGLFIPISVIGITLTAELITKVVVAACFTTALGSAFTGTWLFTRKNDIARSFEKVSTDARAIYKAAPAA